MGIQVQRLFEDKDVHGFKIDASPHAKRVCGCDDTCARQFLFSCRLLLFEQQQASSIREGKAKSSHLRLGRDQFIWIIS